VTVGAKVVCYQRLRGRKAVTTDGNPGDFTKRSGTNPALVWQDEVKQSRRNMPCGDVVDIRQNSE